MGSRGGRGGTSSSRCRWTSYGGTRCRTSQLHIADVVTLALILLYNSKFSIDSSKSRKVAGWTADKGPLSLHVVLDSANRLLAFLLATTFTGYLANVAFLIQDGADVADMSVRISVGSRLIRLITCNTTVSTYCNE